MEENNSKDVPTSDSIGLPEKKGDENPIDSSELIGVYNALIDNLKGSQSEVDEVLSQYLDMVVNGGDASSATKEGVVNLLKLKNVEIPDKMIKIADLMTRVYLKEKDTFPRYLAGKQQQNSISISGEDKRSFIKSMEKKKKEGKKDD